MEKHIAERILEPIVDVFSAIDKSSFDSAKFSITTVNAFTQWQLDGEFKFKAEKLRFNPFSCLTKHHLEELHSKFLYYLLDPSQDHDCGIFFLKEFLQILKEKIGIVSLHEIENDDELSNAKVIREKFIGWSHETENYGRIDIFIETRSYIIAIENKINSGEGFKQLDRYSAFCTDLSKRTGKKAVIIYLTPFGLESQQASIKYFSMSYQHDIVSWIVSSIYKMAQYPSITNGLKYYLSILLKNVLKTDIYNPITKMKEFLLKSENKHLLKDLNANTLLELSEAITAIRNDSRNAFFKKAIQELARRGMMVTPWNFENPTVHIDSSTIWDKKYCGFKLDNKESILSKDGFTLKFGVQHNWEALWLGIYAEDNLTTHKINIDEIFKEQWTQELLNNLSSDFEYFLEAPEDEWLIWKYFELDKSDTSIGNDSLNFLFLENRDELVTKFVDCIENFIKIWKVKTKNYSQST